MDYANRVPDVDHRGQRFFDPPIVVSDVFDIAMIRPRAGFRMIPEPSKDKILIDIGGGNKVIDGYQRLDWPEWDAERNDLGMFGDEEVDGIFSAHALDHISPESVVRLLVEIQRVLKPNATFTIVVPHFMSTLAWECIEHKSRYGVKTWRNILDNPAYHPHFNNVTVPWQLEVGFNMIMGLEERNLVLVTQLVKNGS